MSELAPELSEEEPKLKLVSSLGWISLQDINIDDWWITEDNFTLPRFGAENLGADF